MATTSELRHLLSLVEFDPRLKCIEGLDAFRNLLGKDSDGSVLRFLQRQLPKLDGERRGGIGFALAERFARLGDLTSLQRLYADDDAILRANVLNALSDEPRANPQIGPGIVQMAVDATRDPSPSVRSWACWVIQNQCGWKVDVSSAVIPLLVVLEDEDDLVRMRAACAIGNLAKGKYNMSGHVTQLRYNLRHESRDVRNWSAWALWKLSGGKHDIGVAIPELVQILTDDDDSNEPRKKAVGALLHHARKSPHNREQVRQSLKAVHLDPKHKEIQKLLEKLEA
jgi:HEAT repeat protein